MIYKIDNPPKIDVQPEQKKEKKKSGNEML